MTRAPCCWATADVASLDKSSTTITSYCSRLTSTALRMAATHLPIHLSSLCAGTMNEIMAGRNADRRHLASGYILSTSVSLGNIMAAVRCNLVKLISDIVLWSDTLDAV